MSTPTARPQQPLGSFIKIGADGKPSLEGYKCSSCGEILLEMRRGCPNCAALGTLRPIALSETGRLFSYTIVHRSFPGIETPFISAVVELDGGGILKGNLQGIPPDPAALRFDMPLRVRFDHPPIAGRDDIEAVRHVFVPITDPTL